MIGRQRSDAEHRVAQRGDVGSRPPAEPLEQWKAAQAGDHAAGLRGADRRQPDLDVADQLGLVAARRERHERPEARVARDPQEQLGPFARHRLDQDALGHVAVPRAASSTSRAARSTAAGP